MKQSWSTDNTLTTDASAERPLNIEGLTLGVENTFQPNSKYVTPTPTTLTHPTTPEHRRHHPGCGEHLPAQLKVCNTHTHHPHPPNNPSTWRASPWVWRTPSSPTQSTLHPHPPIHHPHPPNKPLNMEDVTLDVENTFQPNSKYVTPTPTHQPPSPTQQPPQHGGHHRGCGEHLPAQLKVRNTHQTTLTHPTAPSTWRASSWVCRKYVTPTPIHQPPSPTQQPPQHGGRHPGCAESM